jgi:hypothetical protein
MLYLKLKKKKLGKEKQLKTEALTLLFFLFLNKKTTLTFIQKISNKIVVGIMIFVNSRRNREMSIEISGIYKNSVSFEPKIRVASVNG